MIINALSSNNDRTVQPWDIILCHGPRWTDLNSGCVSHVILSAAHTRNRHNLCYTICKHFMKQIALSHDRPTMLNTQNDRTPTHVLRLYSLRVAKTTINGTLIVIALQKSVCVHRGYTPRPLVCYDATRSSPRQQSWWPLRLASTSLAAMTLVTSYRPNQAGHSRDGDLYD